MDIRSGREPLSGGPPSTPRLRRLDARETAEALPYASLVREIARAARELREGRLVAPERSVLPIGDIGGLLCMPAVAEDLGLAKLITVHPGNPRRGLKTIQGEVIVFEAQTGRRLLLLDGPVLTARRTAAVTLLGLQTLASAPLRSVLLIGAGEQAAAHAEALCEGGGVERICIAGRERGAAEALARRIAAGWPGVGVATAEAGDIPPAELEAAEAVIALTTATRPVVPLGVPDRTLVAGVGAYRPDMAEIPPDLIHRRRIVVDHLAGARAEAGDLIQAGVSWNRVIELADLLEGVPAGDAPPTIFKTVGHSSWDLAAARVAVATLGPEDSAD